METTVLNREHPANATDSKGPTVRRSFVLSLEHGLHARPCALLVKTLRPFQSEALVEANGKRASARSITGLMMLACGFGSTMTFTITGDDAPLAMSALGRLFATGFSDALGLQTRRPVQ